MTTTLIIIFSTLFIIMIINGIALWHDIHHQKYGKPIYSKEFLEKTIKDLKQEIQYKIANDEEFRLEQDLDYLEYYENELRKYQKLN